MSVNLSTKLKKLIEDLKIPYDSSAILLNDYLTPYYKTHVSVYDKTVNGETTPVFSRILRKTYETTTPHYNCNIYQNIKGRSIYFSENDTLIFPTDVEDFAWALVYWASKNGEDYNKLPYSPSFTYEDIKFADKDDPIKTYFNLVLINKNTLKPVKLAEFKQWVLEKRDEYLKQVPSTSTDQYFDLAFPAIYYDGTFRFTCRDDKNGTEYCRILYLDIPDSVDAFSLMSSCDKLSYVNPQTVVPELTFISKDAHPDYNNFYFRYNFTAPINDDYIGENELTGTRNYYVKRARTLVKAEIVQNGEYYSFGMSWVSYKIGVDGSETSREWRGFRDENGAYLLTQSNRYLTAYSDIDFNLGERNELTFILQAKDSAINPDGSFKKVVVRLTYNDGVKTTVFEEELQP